MSITLQSIAWKTGLGTTPKFILLSLCDHADDDGWGVYPSYTYTSARTGVSYKTVQRAIQHFKRTGLLVQTRPPYRHHPAEYRIDPTILRNLARENKDVWEKLRAEQEKRRGDTVAPLSETGGTNNEKGYPMTARKGTHSVTQTIREPLVLNSKNENQNVDKSLNPPKPDKQTPEAARSAIADINWNGHED